MIVSFGRFAVNRLASIPFVTQTKTLGIPQSPYAAKCGEVKIIQRIRKIRPREAAVGRLWAFEEAGRVPARETKRPDSEREGEEKHSKGYKRELMYMYHVYQWYGRYMYFEARQRTGGHIDYI